MFLSVKEIMGMAPIKGLGPGLHNKKLSKTNYLMRLRDMQSSLPKASKLVTWTGKNANNLPSHFKNTDTNILD